MTNGPYSWRVSCHEKIRDDHKLEARLPWCEEDGRWRFGVTPLCAITHGAVRGPGLLLYDFTIYPTPEAAMAAADEALNDWLHDERARLAMLAEGAPEVAGQAMAS